MSKSQAVKAANDSLSMVATIDALLLQQSNERIAAKCERVLTNNAPTGEVSIPLFKNWRDLPESVARNFREQRTGAAAHWIWASTHDYTDFKSFAEQVHGEITLVLQLCECGLEEWECDQWDEGYDTWAERWWRNPRRACYDEIENLGLECWGVDYEFVDNFDRSDIADLYTDDKWQTGG